MYIFIAFFMIILYCFLYYMVGSLADYFLKLEQKGIMLKTVIGFFTYNMIFAIFAIPVKCLLLPLSTLTLIWVLVLAFLLLQFIIFLRKTAFNDLKKAIESFNENKLLFCIFFILIGLQVMILNFCDASNAIWDEAYYIGTVSTDVYTNTINQFNPETGYILKSLDAEYMFECYQNHSSVMCQIFKIPALIEVKTVMTSIIVFIYNFIFFNIGKHLFRKDLKKINVFLALLFLINIFSYNLYTASEFFVFRTWEGKTICAVLTFNIFIYYFMKYIKNFHDRKAVISSLLCGFGGMAINMSGIFLLPVLLFALYFPFVIKKRSVKVFLDMVILMIPPVLFMAGYLAFTHFFTITIG
ncbi:hypothetical protein SAMN05216249_10139 [Acetitomaculum ruminis DSM 5522]|uniref:Dolichyl-phosphate-mannose-protein mannosyltransferase n=1 Tax=Acetitomaculum ruminis DSM 5522 TaxID=1120918 RepID=A0A1I0UYR6_9FIRM|nr:DUF6077 domain-containing protein [Acetitomaculum ruminis]SFA68937.1 hypothetical protein SAMN05216249_10139 [Acetitomaculum ruminis DSM 5522]